MEFFYIIAIIIICLWSKLNLPLFILRRFIYLSASIINKHKEPGKNNLEVIFINISRNEIVKLLKSVWVSLNNLEMIRTISKFQIWQWLKLPKNIHGKGDTRSFSTEWHTKMNRIKWSKNWKKFARKLKKFILTIYEIYCVWCVSVTFVDGVGIFR